MDEKQNWQEQYRSLVNRSNEELIELVAGDYRGKTIKELQKNDGSLYHSVQKRGLVDRLVDRGVLYRARRDLGAINSEALIAYVAKLHRGKTINEFQKNDGSLYHSVQKRRLIDKLVDMRILYRARRDLKFLRTMNDDEFMGFVAENYPNMSPSEFKREDRSVYNIALKRKLIGELVDRGVLVRKLKSH